MDIRAVGIGGKFGTSIRTTIEASVSMTSSYVIIMSDAEKECNRFQNRTMAINCIRHQINTEMILFIALIWKWSQRIVLIHRSISIVMYCTQHIMWSRVVVLGNNIISTSAIKRIIQSICYISSANLHLISNCRIFLPWLMARTTRSGCSSVVICDELHRRVGCTLPTNRSSNQHI